MKPLMPKQHGAWAMLIIPFLLGVIAGEPSVYHIPLFLGWFFLYLATNPLLMLVKKKNVPVYLKWTIIYAVPSIIFLLISLIGNVKLVYFGLSMIPFFFINSYFAKIKNERAIWNDFSAITVFCIGGLASYFLGTNTIDGTAWLIFTLCLLFFIGSTFYVKTMIREKKSQTYKYLSWGYHVAVVIALPLLGYAAFVLAFLPSLVRAIYFYGKNVSVMKVGIYEIVNSVLFFIGVIIFI